MKRQVRMLGAMAACLALAGCATNPFLSPETRSSGKLSDGTVVRHASSGKLGVSHARLITGNDTAFRSKLNMIEGAKSSIDAMYYIYSDDYSSSVLTEALIAAARRGVRVRLLVDYHTNYKNLDLFTMMEKWGTSGSGSLEVRFYNRPTRNIVMDAVYLTMGCGEPQTARRGSSCSAAKFAEIERRFAEERIDRRAAAELGISNLNIGNSGLFLSGLYSKKPDLMTLAVVRGQDIDLATFAESRAEVSPQDREKLKKLGELYWNSRVGSPFRRLVAKLQLAVVFGLYGQTLNPIYDTFTAYLPVERKGADVAAVDWEYVTDFLHHKLLSVDTTWLQLGGRNIEDSYHMRPNEMIEKYVFIDTDLRVELSSGGQAIERAFEALWNFRKMVASTAEIRQHAPNHFAANVDAYEEAGKVCSGAGAGREREACVGREFETRALTVAEREARRYDGMREKATRYRKEYPYARSPDPSPNFSVDPGAFVAYVENLPFYGRPGDPATRRSYGAKNGEEARYGKRIHALWLAGLVNACRTATAARPQRVILHHAYFFPPSNLIRLFGRMVNGDLDCRHVRVTVLTNSIETTDLNLVNLLARHSAKAFAEYSQSKRDPKRGARFEYYEYEKFEGGARMSLHTKVSVLAGDMLVGSANADVRSYMMDSNNGMFIRHGTRFIEDYVRYLDSLMRDRAKAKNMTAYFATTSRDQMIAEDRQTFRALLRKYRAERWMDAKEQKRAEALFVHKLDEVYSLTKEILAGGRVGRGQEEKFNRMFKPL